MVASRPVNNEIIRFLRLLWQPGDVRELRVPRHNAYRHTASGYFETPESLAAAAQRFDGKANVFFTLNPVLPDLLARARNRVEDRAENTTADLEIQKRCWLFLDIDPVRPSGISSTEAERESALAVLGELTSYLGASDDFSGEAAESSMHLRHEQTRTGHRTTPQRISGDRVDFVAAASE